MPTKVPKLNMSILCLFCLLHFSEALEICSNKLRRHNSYKSKCNQMFFKDSWLDVVTSNGKKACCKQLNGYILHCVMYCSAAGPWPRCDISFIHSSIHPFQSGWWLQRQQAGDSAVHSASLWISSGNCISGKADPMVILLLILVSHFSSSSRDVTVQSRTPEETHTESSTGQHVVVKVIPLFRLSTV